MKFHAQWIENIKVVDTADSHYSNLYNTGQISNSSAHYSVSLASDGLSQIKKYVADDLMTSLHCGNVRRELRSGCLRRLNILISQGK